MTTKKHNIIVIGCSVAIAISISLCQWNRDPQQFESRVYRVINGWGYDILVNDTLFIRQESIPVIQAHQGFQTEEEAKQAAQLVIRKLRAGRSPALTKPELEKILRVHETENGQ